MAKLAFLGMGVMGAPMAGHLARAGHDVTVWNRTASKAEAWVEAYGGRSAETPRDAAAGAEIVLACVGNDDHIRAVTLGPDGAFAGLGAGGIFVDHSSVSVQVTRELASAGQARDISVIDAPVSGGQAGAENGRLSVMCGGSTSAFERARPVLECYALTLARIGESGAGQQAKFVNQIAIAGLVQGLAEALAFAQKSGIDGRAVLEVISAGAAGSWQMSNRGQTMLDDQFDFGFAVDWMRKDLANCLAAANDVGASLPITALIDQFYKEIQSQGGGRLDTSSLIKRLR